MNTKQEIINNYKIAQASFANLVVPSDDTPEPIKIELEQTYNNYIEWFKSIEKYAEQNGFYSELVRS